MHFVLLDKDVEGREKLKVLLRLLERRACVTELSEWEQLSEVVANRRPDLVLVNWNDGIAPLDAVHALLGRHPTLTLVLTCERPTSAAIRSLLLAGVRGIIPRGHTRRQMLCALELILLDGHYIPVGILDIQQPPEVARESARIDWPPPRRPLFGRGALSPRQQQILRLLTFGATNKSIARKLGISEGTVKIHMAGVFRALGVPNRAAAVGMYNAWLESGNADGCLVADSAAGSLTIDVRSGSAGRLDDRCLEIRRSPTRASASFREVAPRTDRSSDVGRSDCNVGERDAGISDAPVPALPTPVSQGSCETGTAHETAHDASTDSDDVACSGCTAHGAAIAASLTPGALASSVGVPRSATAPAEPPTDRAPSDSRAAKPPVPQTASESRAQSTRSNMSAGDVQSWPCAASRHDDARRASEAHRHWPVNRFRVVRARRPPSDDGCMNRGEPQSDDADDASEHAMMQPRSAKGGRSPFTKSTTRGRRRLSQRPPRQTSDRPPPLAPLAGDACQPRGSGARRRKSQAPRHGPLSLPSGRQARGVSGQREMREAWRVRGRSRDRSRSQTPGVTPGLTPSRRTPTEKRWA
ncbi:DNA-binding response regulator, NarL/FixJ family, contains REC and HTH domains [Chitinasiproducens palmae]|uniref:DNA-binding response regulator, NarL/FixJ family, contains REC and HTH domains n=2 Tax=Chitinasiproducens palmae TaxID=1770053 RepID=A0A1H2PTE0_9BURK|nr:DNA-binding response regulator, NarL/FixJ family, contains REC and HTH domains [Chitinasiproducens palmae]